MGGVARLFGAHLSRSSDSKYSKEQNYAEYCRYRQQIGCKIVILARWNPHKDEDLKKKFLKKKKKEEEEEEEEEVA